MLAGDVIVDARTLLNEPSTSGRYNDTSMLAYLSIAVKEVVRELLFPNSRMWFTTTSGVQEYQIQEVLRIFSVYYAGELIPRTDIPTLEGYQIQMYDNTASGGGPAGGIPAGVPTVYQTTVAPQWSAALLDGAPASDSPSSSFAQPYSQPWYPGRRPVYYFREGAGWLGIVPPPGGAVPVAIDCIRQPAQITSDSTVVTLPDVARQALMWKVVYLAYMSDRGAEVQALRQSAQAAYAQELQLVRHWSRTYSGTARGVKALTQRSVQGLRGQNYSPSGRA